MPETLTESRWRMAGGVRQRHVIAVVSGKGGSGKTMIAAVLARVLDELGNDVLIVDADTGTAGMTYYLGMNLVRNTAAGLSDVVRTGADEGGYPYEKALQRVKGFVATSFFGVGDHRRLYSGADESRLPSVLMNVIKALSKRAVGWIIVDCRGGIDPESVAVCKACDDVILVVEPDTTSFQASQRLVDVLSSNDVADKLRGFIINKVFDDPSVVARNGTSVFHCNYLASVPFDLDATRAFLVGDVPSARSPFGIHVWQGLHKGYEEIPFPPGRVWSSRDFSEVGLSNLDSVRGGIVISGAVTLLTALWAMQPASASAVLPFGDQSVLIVALALGVLAGIEPFRRAVGLALSAYVRVVSRLFRRPRRE